MSQYIELIDKYRIEQSPYDADYNPPNYVWTDNTGEVIRCRECVYAQPKYRRCMMHDCDINEDYFCSWARRKS